MKSEKRAQKFHTDDASLPRSAIVWIELKKTYLGQLPIDFDRPKTGIETIVTMIWKPDLGRTRLLTTDFVKQICVRRYHEECRHLSRFHYI